MGFFDRFKTIETNDSNNLSYLEYRLAAWLNSDHRSEMELSRRYYDGEQDIYGSVKTVIDSNGQPTPVNNVPNATLVINMFRKLVDQKVNYSLGKPIVISTENEKYGLEVNKIFDKVMMMKLRDLCNEAVLGGIAFVYPYYDRRGEFQIKVFDSYEFMPIWMDEEHDELECGVRVYDTEIYENGKATIVKRAEVYTKNGIDRYIIRGNKLVQDTTAPHQDYLKYGDDGYNWDRLPIIPFRYNANEIPLIRDVKELQDALNVAVSNMMNELEASPGNSIFVISNYDGEDLASFRHNLATYRAVKVRTVDGVQGKVDILKTEIDPTSYDATIKQLRRALIENGRGFDAKEERLDGDPNELNINSAYVDLDLDTDELETEFQRGFEELKFFIDQWLIHTGKGDFTEESLEFVFNRNIFINQSQRITDCQMSASMISRKTMLAHHPFVKNVERELRQLEEDEAAEMEKMEQTFQIQDSNRTEPITGGDGE